MPTPPESPPENGFLLIGEETICVQRENYVWGAALKIRRCGVLGTYFQEESQILATIPAKVVLLKRRQTVHVAYDKVR